MRWLFVLLLLAGCATPQPPVAVVQPAIPKDQAENAITSTGLVHPVLQPASSKYPGGWMGSAFDGNKLVSVAVDHTGAVVRQ